MEHIILISGKDSLATAIIQKKLQPNLNYTYIHNPTGADYPEVLDWLNKVEVYLGQPVERVGKDLKTQIYEEGMLPGRKVRFCTIKSKIIPLKERLKGLEATVYYGIRADENRQGFLPDINDNIITKFPLVDAGMCLPDVWLLLEKLDLLPPQFFWQQVYDLVAAMLGVHVGWLEGLHPFEFNQLFSGRTRSNCYFCFFQKISEWIWLLDTHPELFWDAVELEEEVGGYDIRTGEEREKPFTMRSDGSLRKLASRADKIRYKHAKKIFKYIVNRAKLPLFVDEDVLEDEADLLVGTSCGVLCGK